MMKKILLAALTVVMFTVLGCTPDPEPGPGKKKATHYTVTFDKNNTDAGSTDPNPKTRDTKGIKAPDNTVQLPTTAPVRTGYILNGYNTKANGSGEGFTASTAVTGNITVYAQWKKGYRVTFNRNGGATDSVPAFIDVIEPATTIGSLPATDPKREYYQFVEWNYNMDGSGDTVEATDTVDDSFSVYAQWKFVGGRPVVEGNTLVHNYPLVTAATTPALTGEIDKDGKVIYTGGAFEYTFPTAGTGETFNLNDYDYFSITSYTFEGPNSSASGATFNEKGGTTLYPNLVNSRPWWSNTPLVTSLRMFLNQTTSGGISFENTGGGEVTVQITAITYYKLGRYTVSFDLNGGKADPALDPVPDYTTRTGIYEGYGVTGFPSNGTWPADPIRDPTDDKPWFFTGWFDGNEMVTGTSSITKNTALKAGWTDEEPPLVEFITVPNKESSGEPIYRFTMPDGKTWGDVKAITFTMLVPAANFKSSNQRVHITGVYPLNTSFVTTASPGNFVGAYNDGSWAGKRMVIFANGLSTEATLNKAMETSGVNYADKWVKFTIGILESELASEYTSKATFYPASEATGPFLLAAGITGNNDENMPGYYQKDVALILKDNTKVPNDALDEYLVGDSGLTLGQLFFTANGNNPVIREMKYEPKERE